MKLNNIFIIIYKRKILKLAESSLIRPKQVLNIILTKTKIPSKPDK